MTWRDAAALAARSVTRRPGRAVLTVVAVGLATALLTALLTIARTAETRVLGELSKGGPLSGITVAAAEPDPGAVDSDNPRPGPHRDLDDAALRRISSLPGVRSVVPIVDARVVVLVPDHLKLADGSMITPRLSGRRRALVRARPGQGPARAPSPSRVAGNPQIVEDLVGADLRRARQLPVTVLAGRLPTPGSLTEVAVTPNHLARLGLTRADAARFVGTQLEMGSARLYNDGSSVRVRARWTTVTVVGVVAQQAGDGELLGPIEQARVARSWTAAGDDGGRRVGLDSSPYSGLFVIADGLSKVPDVRAAITDIGYSTSAPENLIASVQRYLHVVEIVLSGIGLIALVIASLGIANALLAAIRERRREIGVLKAIGARDRDVLRVFLLEAGALGLIGGVLGAALGFVIARTVGAVVNGYLTGEGLAGVRVGVPLSIVAGGIVGAALLALIAGAVPAWRAAHLPAREAVDA